MTDNPPAPGDHVSEGPRPSGGRRPRLTGGVAPALTPRVPRATYRLQFNHRFTFLDAERLVPYLHRLGISDVYASSYLHAQPGSLHGYDVVDHNALNPELGTEADYDRFVAALRCHGMGQLLDVVPNHVGIAGGQNRWWNDVLENGPASPYAPFFDIDWELAKPERAHKVLLPVLGDQYGRVLENQELALELEDGAFRLRYHDTRFPIAPESATQILAHRREALAATLGEGHRDLEEYESIITALQNLPPRTDTASERVRERAREKEVVRRRLVQLVARSEPVRASVEETLHVVNGKRGDPRSFDLLDRVLADQAYHLAHWRVAAEEINYRRFFDVNELAAIRMENPAVFRETHRLVLALVESGQVTGLRIDHPDGLFDPRRYFLALQRARRAQVVNEGADTGRELLAAPSPDAFERRLDPDPGRPDGRPLYVVAEKILAGGERLPSGWAIHGTTGYEFLPLVGGLFVDAAQARAMTAIYAAFTGQRTPYADLVYASKQLIMDVSLSSELSVLGHALSRLAARNRHSRDFTLASLRRALREVIACFPVYRTYIDPAEAAVSLQDRACVEVAAAFAKRRNPATDASVFDFVRDVLLLRYPESADEAYRVDQQRFVQTFQQVTAPVMAKGVEDTTFYRYHRLVSLNEVGGDPDRFGIGVPEFHERGAARLAQWPAGLSTTSTHDTKRGEDVRMRIHVLSERPADWRAAVVRWHRWNRRHLAEIDGGPAPDRNDEYLLYQTLVGAWPPGDPGPEALAAFAERIQAYMVKATREAKVHTSWVNPNEPYEAAVRVFVAALLTAGTRNRFLPDLVTFARPVARLAMVASLGQTLLKITAPGVPDFYQGTELWDLNLVDPDNRRPVDFALREAALADLSARLAGGDPTALAGALLEDWPSGRVKLYLIFRALACRQRWPGLFRAGDYVPLGVTGRHAAHLVAFARAGEGASAVVLVPRLCASLGGREGRPPLGGAVWVDTEVWLPPALGDTFRDVFTGALVRPPAGDGDHGLRVGDLLAGFPVALLESEGSGPAIEAVWPDSATEKPETQGPTP